MSTAGNLFEHLPAEVTGEQFQDILKTDGVRFERIVSKGQVSPEGFWYDQNENELALVLSGKAKLSIEGKPEEIELGPGGWTFLPAHCKHRVTWTEPSCCTVWLAVFWPVLEQGK